MSDPVFSVFQPVCIGTIKDNQKPVEITHPRQKHPNVNYTVNENNDPVEWYYYIHEQPEDVADQSIEDIDRQLDSETPVKDSYSGERITRNINDLIEFCEIIERDIKWWIVNDMPSDPIDEDNHMEKRDDFEIRKIKNYANHLVVLVDSIVDNDMFDKSLFGSYKLLQKAIENSTDIDYRVKCLAKLKSIAYSVVAPRVNYEESRTISPLISSSIRTVDA